MKKLLIVLTLLVSAGKVPPAKTFNPGEKLKKLNAWHAKTLQSKMKEFEGSSIPPGDIIRSLREEFKIRARDLVGNVPPEKIAPKDSLDAAELYCHAGLNHNKIAAAKRFLTTKPSSGRTYEAHQLMLQGYESLSDAKGLQSVLKEIKPPSDKEVLTFIDQASNYLDKIAGQLGYAAALESLRRLESLGSLKTLMQNKKEGDRAEATFVSIATTRAQLLSDAGRTEEARRVLKEAQRQVQKPSNLSALESATLKLNQKTKPKEEKSPHN